MPRRIPGQRTHQLVDVFELLQRLPAGITSAPIEPGREPDGKGLGKIFVRMTLRVPIIEMHDVAATKRPRMVDIGRLLARGPAKGLLPFFLSRQLVGVTVGVGGFVPDESHEPLSGSALHFEHHRFLQRAQPIVHQKKRNENCRDADRNKPFVADVTRRPQK